MSSESLENILSKLNHVKRSGKGYTARCPAHDDRHNSLGVFVGDDGWIVLNCFAGCTRDQIVGALNLTKADLAPDRNQHKKRRSRVKQGSSVNEPEQGEGRGQNPADGSSTKQRPGQQPDEYTSCTLETYSVEKRLPLAYLQSLGLTDLYIGGVPAVRIPYLDVDGSERAVRFRTALHKGEVGDNRFKWRRESKPCLYGLSRLQAAQQAGHVVLCEGESDCHTLWYFDEPAVGMPGADSWQKDWDVHLEGIPIVYVVIEPDKGGEAVRKWLTTSSFRDRVRIGDLGQAKDPSGLYLRCSSGFEQAWKEALERSTSWIELEQKEAAAKAEATWAKCWEIAQQEDILEAVAHELEARGVVGESRAVKLIYLSMISRLVGRPVSLAVKGPSSAGKSYLVEQTLSLFPQSAYYALSAMSEKALAYSKEPLSHRFLVVYEAAGLAGEFASYLMRSLLSEGCLRYETVDRTSNGLKPRLIEREGPTGLIVTTTAASLHPENETRLLSVPVADTQEQTRRVLMALANDHGPGVDANDKGFDRWHALQDWLELSTHRVVIPYAVTLARAVPPVSVRLRRDFGKVLELVRAHAILHQANRERDSAGRIIATITDYGVVRSLVADLVSEVVGAATSQTVRETVQAVAELSGPESAPVTQAKLAKHLKVDKSAASRRVRVCLELGYLINLESSAGKAHKLVVGDPLPAELEILPFPEALEERGRASSENCCTVDGAEEEVDTPPPHVSPLRRQGNTTEGTSSYFGKSPPSREEVAETLVEWIEARRRPAMDGP